MIVLTDKYAIKSDLNQWMLCKWEGAPKDAKKGDGWTPIKYYSSISQLVQGTSTLLLRKSDYTAFDELLSNQQAINAMIEDKLKGL